VKTSTRLLLLAGVLGLAAAGIGTARPSWSTDIGLDFWSVPALKARMAEDRQFASELATRDDRVLRRIAVKETLIADLVAGRAGLVETAAQFRALNAGQHGYAVVIRSLYPNTSDDERLCRNVISYVETYAEADEDGRALVYRLTEEMNRLKAAGRLTVPGPPLDSAPADSPDDADEVQ
jgi:hypothetical protein